jgi:hypothetical protein
MRVVPVSIAYLSVRSMDEETGCLTPMRESLREFLRDDKADKPVILTDQ